MSVLLEHKMQQLFDRGEVRLNLQPDTKSKFIKQPQRCFVGIFVRTAADERVLRIDREGKA